MHGHFPLLFVALASFAGCGASCKKGAESAPLEEGEVIELPGVDTSALILTEKRAFSKIVHDYNSPCGDPVTLEVCVKEARPCRKCAPAAQAVVKLVQKGEGDKEIRAWLDNRFLDSGVHPIDVAGSPSVGPADAPLLVVEFADFECPHCGLTAPWIHEIVESSEFKPKTRFVFKNYPLPMHSRAEPAARAALAAGRQGKFWDMLDLLFSHQEHLGDADIEEYAKKLGVDLQRFRADWNSAEIRDRVAKDREMGTRLGVSGTPAIFINGRRFIQLGGVFQDQMKEWMRTELVVAPTGPSTSAAPPAQPAPPAPPAPSAAVGLAPSDALPPVGTAGPTSPRLSKGPAK